MSTQDWQQHDPPRGMLRIVREYTQGKAEFARLQRLYACAAARLVWLYVPSGACRRAVEAAELFADGRLTSADLERARAAAEGQAVLTVRGRPSAGWVAANATNPDPFTAALRATEEVLQLFVTDPQTTERNARALGQLLVDLFDPYIDSPGSTPDDPPQIVLAVRMFADDPHLQSAAAQIYQENDFHDMRVFGERLLARGCNEKRALDHCCGGRHARGSWIIDAILRPEDRIPTTS